MSEYTNDIVTYTSNFYKTANKGSIYTHNGIETFFLTAPTTNGQIFTSNLSTNNGTIWSSGQQGIGYAFPSVDVPFPTVGNNSYFLINGSTSICPGLNLFKGLITFLSVRPSSDIGWYNPSSGIITGGNITFSVGYVNGSTQQIPANFNLYTDAPHLTIDYTDINTISTQFSSFFTNLSIPFLSSNQDQICVRITNNLVLSGSTILTPNIGAFISFRS